MSSKFKSVEGMLTSVDSLFTTQAEQKHMELQNKIAELEAEQNKTTPVINYKEKLEVLRYALEQYTDFDADGDIPDSVVEAFVEKIVVSKDGYDWYLRFDGDPNDPLHLKTEGKRRKSTAIIDLNKQTACEPVRDTGYYKRKQIIADFIKQIETPPRNWWVFLV